MLTTGSCICQYKPTATSKGLSILAVCTTHFKHWYSQNGLLLNPTIGTSTQL